jgi:hypothetical protein
MKFYTKEVLMRTRMDFANFELKKLLCGVYNTFKKEQLKLTADDRVKKVNEYMKAFDEKVRQKIVHNGDGVKNAWTQFFKNFKFDQLDQKNLDGTLDNGFDCEKEAKDLGDEDVNKYAKYLHYGWVALIGIFAFLFLTFCINCLEFAIRPIRNCGWRCSVNGFVMFFIILLFALGMGIMIIAPKANTTTSDMMKHTADSMKKSLNSDLKEEVKQRISSSPHVAVLGFKQILIGYSNEAIDEIGIEFFGEYIFTVKSESSPLFLVVTASILIIFIGAFCSMKFEEEEKHSVWYADDLEDSDAGVQVTCHELNAHIEQEETTKLEVEA